MCIEVLVNYRVTFMLPALSVIHSLIDASSSVRIKHFGQLVVGRPVDAEVTRLVDGSCDRLVHGHASNERMAQRVAVWQLTTQSLRHSAAQCPRQVSRVKIITYIITPCTVKLFHLEHSQIATEYHFYKYKK